MQRRKFLKQLAITPAIAANSLGGLSFLSMMKDAIAATGKTLIVIFQRGGCDGLNTVIPYGEDEYYNLRKDISIAPAGSGKNGAIDLDGFFGFHPALAPFQDIYQQGNMAILPTVHYQNGIRSHFASQDYIENGVIGTASHDGWLNRHLSSLVQGGELRAACMGEMSQSLNGSLPVSIIPNLADLTSAYDNDFLTKNLNKIFQQLTEENRYNLKRLNNHGQLMLDNIKSLTSLEYASYSPANGATYPDSSYGQLLQQTAYLIKAGLGLEIVTINHEGWDHHARQGGTTGLQANRLLDFSSGISALYQDLGATRMDDIIILTMTEFGRTAKQNASGGTDHGNASTWFVFGDNINGGIYGEWPGLQEENLYLGRYLQHTVDFRDIFAEVIKNHLGNNNISAVLPNHNYQPVGFI